MFKKLIILVVLILSGMWISGHTVVDPEMKDVDWPEHKRELTYCFEGKVPDDIKKDVRDARDKWNDADVGWKLKEAEDCTNADIKVKYEDKQGASIHAWKSSGGVFSQNGITIRGGKIGRLRRVMHEFGHAMRVGHKPECTHKSARECQDDRDSPCKDENNVMAAHQYFQNLDLSAEDKNEAKTSAKAGEGCKKQVKTNPPDAKKGESKTYTITGDAGTDLNLSEASNIIISPFFPGSIDIDTGSIHWDTVSVYVNMTPSYDSYPHEGFDVEIAYYDGDTSKFWGILWITDSDLPPLVFPHAVTGNDTTIREGNILLLDGSSSFHDEPNIKLTHFCWSFLDYGTYGAGAEVTLPGGNYPVILKVYDEFGQSSSDTLEVTVTLPCGDINGDSMVTVADVVYLINYLFKGGASPQCPPEPPSPCADANVDGQVTISDVIYLINYLFRGGPPPGC